MGEASTLAGVGVESRVRRRRAVGWRVVALLAVVVAVAVGLTLKPPPPATAKYVTGTVTRGDVAETLETTGTLEPLVQVQVGAQVSGRVSQVHVDFNQTVKKGDLLAEIDRTPFQAQVAQARAVLASAEAQLVRAQVDMDTAERALERAQALREKAFNAEADVDVARGARDAAAAQVNVIRAQIEQARAALDAALTNLGFTRIRAPVDGTVINRAVEPGQTVAASLQTPTLFVIAQDLTSMRVVASVDESDVAKVREGAPVRIHVDAFPADEFHGEVKQLRVQPTTTSGVVTYPAVINVPNPERKLRPGMTATVTLVSNESKDVLRVPNAALRFTPSGAPELPGGKRHRVHVLDGNFLKPVEVVVGLNDGAMTQVSSPELSAGTAVVLDENTAGPGGPPPAGARPPMRGPPRIF
ncbi:MAG: efflux RND transporter periplasmic adaptor subunit [Myxococcota bacterium]